MHDPHFGYQYCKYKKHNMNHKLDHYIIVMQYKQQQLYFMRIIQLNTTKHFSLIKLDNSLASF